MASIAWIEDDHDRIGALVNLLENDGHKIHKYRSYDEFRKDIALVKACDVIIIDLILPPIEDDPYLGLSVLDELRNEHGFTSPVVVCSLVENPVVLTRLRDLGVKSILTKPVRPSVLYSVVTEALQAD